MLKEINPEYSLEGLMLKLMLRYFGHLMQRANSLEKTLILGKTEGKKKVKVKSLSRVQLFVTLWTVAYQAPTSMGIFQARILEWVAISFSRGSSQPRDQTQVFHVVGRHFIVWATREVLPTREGKKKEGGKNEMLASLTQWTWIWAKSGR